MSDRSFLFVAYIAVLLCACLVNTAYSQESSQEPQAPLTKEELINICNRPLLKDNPNRVLEDFIKRNKIAFLPTRNTIQYLNQNGVPKLITDELKHNFSSRIVYKVCSLQPNNQEAKDFTNSIISNLEDVRFFTKNTYGSLLKDKSFDPLPAGVNGLSQPEIRNNPHTGFVLIMGSIDVISPGTDDKQITVRLCFVSKSQSLSSISKPFIKRVGKSSISRSAVAKEIAKWSLEEVERQIR